MKFKTCGFVFQSELDQSDSDEEPSPEAMARYLSMRRHTVSMGGPPSHGAGDLMMPRMVAPNAAPNVAPMQTSVFNPISYLPHCNLPQNLPLVQHEPVASFMKDHNLLKPPQGLGAGKNTPLTSFEMVSFCQKFQKIVTRI